MKSIKIIGIGVISSSGNDIESIWSNVVKDEMVPVEEGEIKFDSVLSSGKRRRMNRYSDMAVYTTSKAIEDAGLDLKAINPYRIGTIFSTGYGPMVSNLAFGEVVARGEQDLCSPTVFANTVSNACVGHVCMNFGFMGVSTIIMGSNNIGYSQMLISKGNADYILSGAVEEYCEDLYKAFKHNEISKGAKIKEGAVTFLLQNVDLEVDESKRYCDVIDFREANLGEYPLVTAVDEAKARKRMVKVLKEMDDEFKGQIDAVFTSCNGTYFDKVENEAVKEVLGEKIVYVSHVKQCLGETLGSAFNMNLMMAALSLKKKEIPGKLTDDKSSYKEPKCVLVTGYDVSGNYVAILLKR